MSQGCPVLVSNKSALVEINSDAVEYFNPDMVDEIKLKMLKILDNYDYRKKLIEKGNYHFKKFSWDQTVKEIIKILFNFFFLIKKFSINTASISVLKIHSKASSGL